MFDVVANETEGVLALDLIAWYCTQEQLPRPHTCVKCSAPPGDGGGAYIITMPFFY